MYCLLPSGRSNEEQTHEHVQEEQRWQCHDHLSAQCKLHGYGELFKAKPSKFRISDMLDMIQSSLVRRHLHVCTKWHLNTTCDGKILRFASPTLCWATLCQSAENLFVAHSPLQWFTSDKVALCGSTDWHLQPGHAAFGEFLEITCLIKNQCKQAHRAQFGKVKLTTHDMSCPLWGPLRRLRWSLVKFLLGNPKAMT